MADDGLEDSLRRNRPVADEAAFRDRSQHGPRRDAGGGGSLIQHPKNPGRHRDGADAAVLAEEVDDRPAALGLGDIAKLQPRQLPLLNPHPTSIPSSTRSRRPLTVSGSRAARSRRVCSMVSQLPLRTPERRAPETPPLALAVPGSTNEFAEASAASLRSAARCKLIEAAESDRSSRCER